MNTLLACTEGAFFEQAARSLLVFGLLKPLSYVAFIMAFRYRVCRRVPLSMPRVCVLAAIRGAVGLVVIGLSSQILPQIIRHELGVMPHESPEVALALRAAVTLERLVVWLALGWFGAGLRGRRLAGWTLSGAGIDLAYDFAVERVLPDGLAPVWAIAVLVGGFVATLWAAGHRASLTGRFASGLNCTCGYDLTGNLSGRCPECGSPVPGG